jgi:chlorite dismutase
MTAGPDSTSVDTRERGTDANGQPILLDRRLFMQLLVFQCETGLNPKDATQVLGDALREREIGSVIYEDANHPRGLAVLTYTETPEDLVRKVRPIYQAPELERLTPRPEFAMIGRSYSTGYEQDLEYWLLRRPRQTVTNEAWPWAIWYPLRRKGGFERLEPREKGGILREHGGIGRAYGESDLAHDVRLACHGLDAHDNDFVIGLIGKSLHPLSHVVQAMRATRQTAEFMEQMGPFFTGYAVFRNAV